MLTWWEPLAGDPAPLLEVDLNGTFDAAAVRIIWKDVGLDYDGGVRPGPFRYRVSVSPDGQAWRTVVDASDNSTDWLIDYRVFDMQRARLARLEILGAPPHIRPGVVDFTLFGMSAAG